MSALSHNALSTENLTFMRNFSFKRIVTDCHVGGGGGGNKKRQ